MRRGPLVAVALAVLAGAGVAWLLLAGPSGQPAARPRTATGDGIAAVDSVNPPSPSIAARPPPMWLSADAGGAAAPTRTAATGVRVLEGAWGAGAGQFGRLRNPESAPEMPMAIVAGAGGELFILDQINHRVQRWRDGRLQSPMPVGGGAMQDLAAAPGGRLALLDRLADREVQIWDASGKLENEVPLVGRGVPEGGGVTGVFADDKGVYVEREHGTLVRIADARGNTDAEREELPGRPTRDGRFLVAAAIVDRAAGVVLVRAFDRLGRGSPGAAATWEARVMLGAPILHVLMLESDRHGHIYLASDTGREAPEAPYPIVDEAIVVARLTAAGATDGLIALPAVPSPDESFRPMSVDDEGGVYVMQGEAGGLAVLRYTFPS